MMKGYNWVGWYELWLRSIFYGLQILKQCSLWLWKASSALSVCALWRRKLGYWSKRPVWIKLSQRSGNWEIFVQQAAFANVDFKDFLNNLFSKNSSCFVQQRIHWQRKVRFSLLIIVAFSHWTSENAPTETNSSSSNRHSQRLSINNILFSNEHRRSSGSSSSSSSSSSVPSDPATRRAIPLLQYRRHERSVLSQVAASSTTKPSEVCFGPTKVHFLSKNHFGLAVVRLSLALWTPCWCTWRPQHSFNIAKPQWTRPQ